MDIARDAPRVAQATHGGARPAPASQAATMRRLQRSMGNYALGALITRATDGRGLVQRAIGLELEVQGTQLWEGGELDGERTLLEYGTRVAEVTDRYHVESDTGRLEIVTKAFDETTAGRVALLDAASDAAKLVTEAQAIAERSSEEGSPRATSLADLLAHHPRAKRAGAESSVAQWVGRFADPEEYLDNPRVLWAKPQASIGVALDKLDVLAAAMRETGFAEDSSVGDKDWAEGFLDRHQYVPGDLGWSTTLSNLLTLVCTHLVEAGAVDETYPYPIPYAKARHSLMPRTNFKVMLTPVLPEFVTATPPEEGWLAWFVGMSGHEDAGEQVYPYGYYDDEIDERLLDAVVQASRDEVPPPTAAAAHFVKGPTLAEFLRSVFPAEQLGSTVTTDGMAGRVAPHLPATLAERGMGSFTRSDRVKGPPTTSGEGTTVEAPIFEVRTFTGPTPPEEWEALAAQVFDLTVKVNERA